MPLDCQGPAGAQISVTLAPPVERRSFEDETRPQPPELFCRITARDDTPTSTSQTCHIVNRRPLRATEFLSLFQTDFSSTALGWVKSHSSSSLCHSRSRRRSQRFAMRRSPFPLAESGQNLPQRLLAMDACTLPPAEVCVLGLVAACAQSSQPSRQPSHSHGLQHEMQA